MAEATASPAQKGAELPVPPGAEPLPKPEYSGDTIAGMTLLVTGGVLLVSGIAMYGFGWSKRDDPEYRKGIVSDSDMLGLLGTVGILFGSLLIIPGGIFLYDGIREQEAESQKQTPASLFPDVQLGRGKVVFAWRAAF
ncbi:MAG: hypothetical protein HY897_15180 [Deltaproteobacteria bacterium]|nr:hypothetical protein [Deltaproteobacteria bacterium]